MRQSKTGNTITGMCRKCRIREHRQGREFAGDLFEQRKSRVRRGASAPIRRICIGLWLLAVCPTPAEAQTLYWTDIGTSKIQRADVFGASGIEDLITSDQVFLPVSIAVDEAGGKMYWTEASPADFMIGQANLDGTNVQYMIAHLVEPSGIAVDTAAGKLYWTDIGTGKIQRANLDGSSVEDLVTSQAVTPVEIALHRSAGKMYWTDPAAADFQISRADFDGGNVEGLVSGLSDPSGITLDASGTKMYWTDRGSSSIQRANLDGTQAEDLVTSGLIEPVRIVLDDAAGKMFWTEASPADFMISRANLDGSGIELLVTGLTSPSGIDLIAGGGPQSGACCFGNGFCIVQTQEDCEAVEGQLYLGDGTKCVGDMTCPAVCVICRCVDGFVDARQSAIGCVAEEAVCDDTCQAHGGAVEFQCDIGACPSVPTSSEWGLVITTLIILGSGTLILGRRCRTVPA